MSLKYQGADVASAWTKVEEDVFKRAMAEALDSVPSADAINVTFVYEITGRRLVEESLPSMDRRLADSVDLGIDFTVSVVSPTTNPVTLGEELTDNLLQFFNTTRGDSAGAMTPFDELLTATAGGLGVLTTAVTRGQDSVVLLTVPAIVSVLAVITTPPTIAPTATPTLLPTLSPSSPPTMAPSLPPSPVPTPNPTLVPTGLPSGVPTMLPTVAPTPMPTPVPSSNPTPLPSETPTPAPTTPWPTPVPSLVPTPEPSIADFGLFDSNTVAAAAQATAGAVGAAVGSSVGGSVGGAGAGGGGGGGGGGAQAGGDPLSLMFLVQGIAVTTRISSMPGMYQGDNTPLCNSNQLSTLKVSS